MNHRKKIGVLVALGFSMMLIVSVPTAKAQFVIASWAFPDEYGQGIERISVDQNSTGSWLPVDDFDYNEASMLDWNVSIGIRLRCYTWFNSTLTDSADDTDGQNRQRHNVTVTDNNGIVVFSQQNFTQFVYYPSIDPPLWKYGYEVILNFLPDYGQIYTVTVTYEVCW